MKTTASVLAFVTLSLLGLRAEAPSELRVELQEAYPMQPFINGEKMRLPDAVKYFSEASNPDAPILIKFSREHGLDTALLLAEIAFKGGFSNISFTVHTETVVYTFQLPKDGLKKRFNERAGMERETIPPDIAPMRARDEQYEALQRKMQGNVE